MIKLPLKLDADLLRKVIDAYEVILKEVSHDDVRYVALKLPRVYNRLSKHDGDWCSILALYANTLFNEVLIFNGRNMTDEGKVATAALYYLCNPQDVIPDSTPGTGYMDDALVINLSLIHI